MLQYSLDTPFLAPSNYDVYGKPWFYTLCKLYTFDADQYINFVLIFFKTSSPTRSKDADLKKCKSVPKFLLQYRKSFWYLNKRWERAKKHFFSLKKADKVAFGKLKNIQKAST